MTGSRWIVPFDELSIDDVPIAGGKNASLGEMIRELTSEGIAVPGGFAATAAAYWEFVDGNGLRAVIGRGGNDASRTPESLREVGATIRAAFRSATVGDALADQIRSAYRHLCDSVGDPRLPVAVRSSATAEDLPGASFAGQHESYLNIVGDDAVVEAYHRCLTSLFGDRAIAYREENGFGHLDVALSVGVQQMVRSDVGGAGVIFTLDPESGFPDTVLIDAAWGLGESVVKGEVDCDRYQVAKPLLDDVDLMPILSRTRGRKQVKVVNSPSGDSTVTVDTGQAERESFVLEPDEIVQLARWAVAIEAHYGRPMDIEWAKDGVTQDLYVVQARPETVQARKSAVTMTHHTITKKGRTLVEGLAVGGVVAAGRVCRLASADEGGRFPDGGVLVAETTDPDWVPVIRRAAALVTDRGGRTSHAAIVSRELGVPAVVGTQHGTALLADGQVVTVSCAEGDVGYVYEGEAEVVSEELALGELPPTRTNVMLNLANPDAALEWWRLPADGIGLVRMEFIVSEHIKAHPMALAHVELVTDATTRTALAELTRLYDSPSEYFVDRLASGIATLAAPWFPRPVILRMSDFKTDEYAKLLGGAPFEPAEANPMLGWRGASRYYHPGYRDGFALECQAVKRVREQIGLTNVVVMVPFCRTPGEADRVLEVMAEEGLVRGENGLKVYVMAEIPSNVILAEEFATRFDGFSIGSNDLTQLTLGVDRDSAILAGSFGADDPAVLTLVRQLIERAHAAGRPVGFCGQAPSNDPAYARLLVDAGVDSVSVTPDSFVAVKRQIALAETTP